MLTFNPNDNWPRFLVVEAADGNPKRLTDRMDIFAWYKAIIGMGGSYKSVKPMNDGKQLLVHLKTKPTAIIFSEQTNWSTFLLKWHPTEHSILQDVWLDVKSSEIWMKRT